MAILITGANRGIGRALFDRYRDAGEPVIGTARGDLPTTGDLRELDLAATGCFRTWDGRDHPL